MKDRLTSGNKLTPRQIMRALFSVGKTTLQVAPGMAIFQIVGSIISSALPIIATYFASLTTTALAEAFVNGGETGSSVVWLVVITAGLGVFVTGWLSVQSYFDSMMRYKIEGAVSDQLYEHFFKIDFWRYDDKETADTFEKAQHFVQFFSYIFSRLTDMITQIFTVITVLVLLGSINLWIASIVLITLVPSVVIQFKLSRLSVRHWQNNVETRRRLNWVEWGMFHPSKIAELRLSGIVRELLDLRLKLRDKDQKVRLNFEKKFVWKRLGADIITASGEIISLVWIALEIVARKQPIGQFLFVQQTVSRAVSSIGSLTSTISNIDEDISKLFDYQKIMDYPENDERDKTEVNFSNAIRFENVKFAYPGAEDLVLKGVSLTIEKGQCVAIVGENGAGKTTLLKILGGLYVPQEGSVSVDGTPSTEINLELWHKQISILSQDFIRYDFATVKENIWYGDTSTKLDVNRLEKALIVSGSDGFIKKLPKGIDSYVDKWMESDDGIKGAELSGGQWQRLALARSFYRGSPVMVLDEPTSAIDALAEARIFNELFKLKDKTLIIVSHRLTTVKKADIIYVMEDGRVVESGTHAELVDLKGKYYKMFEAQL